MWRFFIDLGGVLLRVCFRILSVVLLVLWMGVIFFFSSQNATESSASSGSVIEKIAEVFYPDFEEKTQIEKEEIISSFQFLVRKSAHLASFAVLGVLAFLSFVSYCNLKFSTRVTLSVLICCIYAASDEIHQLFVVGRSCELRDFLIDTIGVFIGTAFCVFIFKFIKSLRVKTAYKGNF